jgi:NADH-quinone oxidoreductase subunit A
VLAEYAPILLLGGLATLLGLVVLAITFILGPRDPRPPKSMPYESGMTPIGRARRRVPVRFYVVATLFILFDVEVIYLYPWAVVFRRLAQPVPAGIGPLALGGMGTFVALLVIGLGHAWRRGALDWNQ